MKFECIENDKRRRSNKNSSQAIAVSHKYIRMDKKTLYVDELKLFEK